VLLSKFTQFQKVLLALSSEHKVEPVAFCETLQTFWQTTRCHIPKDIQPDHATILSRNIFCICCKIFSRILIFYGFQKTLEVQI